jgi:hypothetical protein
MSIGLAGARGAAAAAATAIADVPTVIAQPKVQWGMSAAWPRVHASFTRLQRQLGPWGHVARGAHHQFLKG